MNVDLVEQDIPKLSYFDPHDAHDTNDKKDIYSGVVKMDTVKIGFFLGQIYGISCCTCDIGNSFLYGKTKEKVYITAGPEFGAILND
jgi:hypothetical protein